jgi:hypothetical protein
MIKRILERLGNTRWYKFGRRILLSGEGRLRPWTVPAVLSIVIVMSYGLYARHLGFYWDDWIYAWSRHFLGYRGLMTAAPDVLRPLRAYVEIAVTPILGTNPLAWQIYAMLLRWLVAVTIWWFLRQLWAKHSRPIFVVALIYAVYPGFSQQSMALTYHYFWITQAVFFLSLGLMVRAVRNPRYFWPGMIGALAGSAVQMYSSEYLVGLELLRPLLLWIALAGITPNIKQRLGQTTLYSAPFLLILGLYFYWRVWIYGFPTYQPVLLDQIRATPVQALLGLLKTVWHTLGVVTVGAWENALQIDVHRFVTRFPTIYPLLVVAGVIGSIVYLNRLQPPASSEDTPQKSDRTHAWQFILVGLVAILAAGIPYYIAGLPVQTHFEGDRWSLAFILGVGLLATGLLDLLPDPRQGIVLVAVLVGLSIGLQFYNASLFRAEAELQKSFAWQLAWRAPALEPGTLLVSDNLVFPYTDDEGLTFLANWIYAPETRSHALPVAFATLETRLGHGIPALQPGQAVTLDVYSSAAFAGSTDRVLAVYFNPPSCLRVLDPAYDGDLAFLQVVKTENGLPVVLNSDVLPPRVAAALPLSNVDQIIPTPDRSFAPPAFLYGPEPGHTWCYFFEKADLARQDGGWQAIADLGDQAFGNQLFAWDLSEYLVFIEAYARLGRWEDVDRLTQMITSSSSALDPALCGIWQRVGAAGGLSEDGQSRIELAEGELGCHAVP